MTMTIEPHEAAKLYSGGDGDHAGLWSRFTTVDIERGRWHQWRWLVLIDVTGDTGGFWGLRYGVGLTEEQEHELPWDGAGGPLELTRLYRHAVMRVEYRTAAETAP
jgi:hypothetical protein